MSAFGALSVAKLLSGLEPNKDCRRCLGIDFSRATTEDLLRVLFGILDWTVLPAEKTSSSESWSDSLSSSLSGAAKTFRRDIILTAPGNIADSAISRIDIVILDDSRAEILLDFNKCQD